jgi:predicted ATPase
MIGLSGTQRTGKTTLARAFAEKQDIPVVLTTASGVYHSLGLDPARDYPIHIRLGAQEAVLLAFEKQYAAATAKTPLFITDRTPLDLASYMLADVQRSTFATDTGVALLVTDYVERCFASLNRWFSTVLLVQPGISTVNEEGKALACPAFMEHQNSLLRGLLADERSKVRGFVIGRQFTGLDDRVKCVGNAVMAAFERHTMQIEQHKAAGGKLH